MKRHFERYLQGFDARIGTFLATVRGRVLWPALIAVALGVSVWTARHLDRMGGLARNDLHQSERVELLWHIGGAAGVWLLALLGLTAIRRRQQAGWQADAGVAQLTRATSWILGVPFVLALALPNIEVLSPKLCFFFVGIAAAACVPSLLALGGEPGQPPPWRARLERVEPRLGLLMVALMAGAYAWFFSGLAITNHHAFNTRTADLGYYDNIFYQSAHGHPLASTFLRAGYHGSAHFDPLLLLLSPIYRLVPGSETLLVLQTAWIALGAFPVYHLALSSLRSARAGVVLAAAFLLYPALHGANLYEFHSLTLLSTPLLWAILFLRRGAALAYAVSLALCLLVREDAALVLACLGLHTLFAEGQERRRFGWATVLVSVGHFVVAKAFFMTSAELFMGGKDSYSFEYYYRELIPEGQGFAGLVTSLVTNPVFVIQHAFTEEKALFLLVLFGPLLFLPLLTKPGRTMMLYGAAFLLLASREPVFSPHFQYTVVLFPFLFALVPGAILRLEGDPVTGLLGVNPRRLRTVLLGLVLLASVLVSWKFGGIVDNGRFFGGYRRVVRSLTQEQRVQYAQFKALIAQIPKGASLTVTDTVGPHVSARDQVYLYQQRTRTDWVLVDERDLKRELETLHQTRLQQGELALVGASGTMKLFRWSPPSPSH